MKQQLLILGNGFDLHCGLRSSYRDFFRSEILYAANKSFGSKLLQPGVSGFWESLLLEYYKLYDNQDYNWCDIEAIIKDTLLSIYFGKHYAELNINQGLCFKASKYIHTPLGKLHLEELNEIEMFIFQYCIKFISTNGGEFKDNIRSLTKNLYRQLHILEKRFCKFLKNQLVNPKNPNQRNTEYIIKAVNLLANLADIAHYEFYKIDDIITVDSRNHLNNVFNNLDETFILNFNYTAIFDILKVESPCFYNNVHGKLYDEYCQDFAGSNIIFGVDDNLIQSQDMSSDLRIFSKTYRKMFAKGAPNIILPPNDGTSIAIKFYGHSLNEADYSYFQSIFDHYNLYGNSSVDLIFYYSKGFENHDAVYRLISEYGKTLTNKEQGKNLIHKLLLENRLHIQEVR